MESHGSGGGSGVGNGGGTSAAVPPLATMPRSRRGSDYASTLDGTEYSSIIDNNFSVATSQVYGTHTCMHLQSHAAVQSSLTCVLVYCVLVSGHKRCHLAKHWRQHASLVLNPSPQSSLQSHQRSSLDHRKPTAINTAQQQPPVNCSRLITPRPSPCTPPGTPSGRQTRTTLGLATMKQSVSLVTSNPCLAPALLRRRPSAAGPCSARRCTTR